MTRNQAENNSSLLQWRYQEIARIGSAVTRMRIEAAAAVLIVMWISDQIPVCWSALLALPFLAPLVLILFWPAITSGKLITHQDAQESEEMLLEKMIVSIEKDIAALRKTLETMKKIRNKSLLRFFKIPKWKGGYNDDNRTADTER